MGGQPGKPKPPGNPPVRPEPQEPRPIEEPPTPIPVPPMERPPAPIRADQVSWATPGANGAFIDAPEPGPKYSGLDCPLGEPCEWSGKSYTALRSLIENSVPLAGTRNQVLQEIAILEKPPYAADEGLAEAWTNLAKESARSAGSYFDTLAEILKEMAAPPMVRLT
jgi:hypothetical protein